MRSSWNRQLVSIYSKGRQAFNDGVKLVDNPYSGGERSGTGISCPGGNLQRQRAMYWADGWRSAAVEVEEQPTPAERDQ